MKLASDFSLIQVGPSKPSKLAEECGVDRSRVYDSLRRLSKKGYVLEEPVKRGPLYKAIKPQDIMRALRKEFHLKNELSSTLEKTLENFKPISKQPFLMAINGQEPIFKEVLTLISHAEDYIKILLTPDYSMNLEFLTQIANALVEKKQSNPAIDIQIALNHQEGDYQLQLKKMHESKILIFLWYIGKVFPYGLYISERSYIFTTLDKIGVIPTYNMGLMLENAHPEMTEGLKQLFVFNSASYFIQGKIKEYPVPQEPTENKRT